MYEATVRTAILGPDEPEPPDRIAVHLYPTGTKAKGWGWEPDTRAAIAWLEERVQLGMTVCDVGTGTGILALVAARLGAKVTAYEQNGAMNNIAAQNMQLNGISIDLRDEYDGAQGFDLVVANLGDVDYEGMGVLSAGREVWTTPPPLTEAERRQAEIDAAVADALKRAGFNG